MHIPFGSAIPFLNVVLKKPNHVHEDICTNVLVTGFLDGEKLGTIFKSNKNS